MKSLRPFISGAIALPIVMTVYLLFLGYGMWTPPPGMIVLWFYGWTGVLGGALAVGYQQRMRVSLGLIAIGLIGLPVVMLNSNAIHTIGDLAGIAGFIAAGGTVAIGAEFLVRERKRVTDELPTRILVGCGVVGVGHLVAVVAIGRQFSFLTPEWFSTRLFGPDPLQILIAFITICGVVLMGAVPAVLYARWRLVSPPLVVGAVFVWAIVQTWRHLDYYRGISPASPIENYFVVWFLPLGIAIAFGIVEYAVRKRYRVFSPPKASV